MSNDRRKKLIPKNRLALVACVILGWVVYRTTRNYQAHGGWDPIDLISTAVGACFGTLIGVGIFWYIGWMAAQQRR